MATAEGSASSNSGALAATVAKHYNELKESGVADRTKSRIFYQRNFNNWIKSMLISDFLNRIKRNKGPDHPITVLDLCCGKGGDLLKWKKGNIHSLVLADIAGTSVEQAEIRYQESVKRNRHERHASKLFSAQFLTADCAKERLRDLYGDPSVQFGLTSCQFSFHYSFESYAQADMMVRNACENLRPGGYFVGTTPDANQLVKRLRASDDMSFGNDVYRVSFHGTDKDNLPLFGAKYDFHLEGVVDCPEFLVFFPAFEKIAEKYGMQLILKLPFSDFFKKHVADHEGRGLLGRMQALEPYPAEENIELMAGVHEEAYRAAHEHVHKLNQDGRQRQKVGTLSEAEWEATTIYLVFAFQKIYDNTAPEPAAKETADIPTTDTADTEVKCTEDTADVDTPDETEDNGTTETESKDTAEDAEAGKEDSAEDAESEKEDTSETEDVAGIVQSDNASDEDTENVLADNSSTSVKRPLGTEDADSEEKASKAAKTEEET